jgi:RNA polymerase sigma-70 factor (ECF subfamily)
MSTAGDDFNRLLSLARDGDGPALGRLLDGYRNYLLLLVRLQLRRTLRCKVDPADLVQDAYLEAHRDFASFRGTSEPELLAWLRRILATTTANLIRHYLGTRRRDVRLERQVADELDRSSVALDRGFVARHSSPSERAARRERAVLLADVLQSLPPAYGEVIILRHLEELSFPEIARRLGRSLDSVKKLWVRGLAQLRERLEDAP